MIRLATPVADWQGRKRGIVILNYYGNDLLRAFAGAASDMVGHNMLINREGYWLKSLESSDEWGFMFNHPELSMAARSPVAWEHIRNVDEGQLELDDGLWTWGTVYPLQVGQKSSIGSAEAFAPSRGKLEERQYFWKSVVHLPPRTLSAIRHTTWIKIAWILILLLSLAGLASWLLVRSWKLLASERVKFRTVSDFAYDWETWIYPNGQYAYCSPSCARITGRTANEFLADPDLLLKIIHPDDRVQMAEHLQQHIAPDAPCDLETRIVHPDGQVRWLGHSCQAVFSESGKYLGRRATNRDITERKRLEEEMLRERDFAESLIDTAQAIVLVLDPEGRIVLFNHYMEELSGYQLAELKGESWFDTFLPEKEYEEILKLFKKALAETRTMGNINPIQAKDGRKILIEWYDKTLKDQGGNIIGLLAIGQDVTLREKLTESQRLLKAAVEQSISSIVVTDGDGEIIFVNAGFTLASGYSQDEVIGQNPRLLKSGEISVEIYADLWATIASGRSWIGELCNKKKNGELYWENVNISPIVDEHGKITHYLAVKDDISLRKRAEAEIIRLSKWNELLLNSAGEGIYGVDIEGRCTFINPAALAMLGLSREEVLGHNQHVIFHHHRKDGTSYPQEECPIYQTLHDGIRRGVEDAFFRNNGEIFPVQLSVTPMHEDGQIVGVEVVFQDIAKRKELELELMRLATTDPLTGMSNRRHFIEQFEMELAHVIRFEKPAAFLMLDIDHFKRINDSYGHATGDAVLKHFAVLARQFLRRIDLFGRLGGEEFGIVLPGTDVAGAVFFAERFRSYMADTAAQYGEKTISVTISIGIALFTANDKRPDSIMARADEALYRAKSNGRNRVEVSEI
jgi:diguanylate cyclase (GGDEF)-like protein/PAS domain S-box-containing protein